MSSRSRPARKTATAPPTPSRSSRSKRIKDEDAILDTELAEPGARTDVEDEQLEDGAADDNVDATSDLTPEPSASSPSERMRQRGRGRGKGRIRGRGRGGKVAHSRERTGTGTADEGEETGKNLRLRKSVSYREVPVETFEDEQEEEEEEPDAEGEEVDVDADEENAATPRARLLTSEQPVTSPSRRELERVGTGRGGFSVKGAAAAAARARWAKYRSDKAERGDDSDDADRTRRSRGAGGVAARKGDSRAAAERIPEGSTIEIKGTEYVVGDDELVLDGDEKGDLKVDENGALLGGREYRLVTFFSESRKNPARVYALTIDAARACGYTDSLAFLRRCPQVLKLACNADERQMLIDIGRVTGNLKNRMVTMVSMRNVYKLMGARVVKDGKWVTDDYYEDKALAECVENGFAPYAAIHEDEIMANALAHMGPSGRPAANANNSGADQVVPRAVLNLAPTYTLGGPTTHFAGSGSDPWSEAGWGNKRTKLKNMGVTEEDWMYRTALESRAIDEQLRGYREERLGRLEGKDLDGWVYRLQHVAEGSLAVQLEPKLLQGGTEEEEVKGEREKTVEWLRPPMPERRRSALSQEVIPEAGATMQEPLVDPQTLAAGDVQMQDDDTGEETASRPVRTGADIVIESSEEAQNSRAKYSCGVGSWEPGVVQGIIEPHTHTPHIPQHTQPYSSATARLAQYPLISSVPDKSYRNHIQSSISGTGARGLASVEFVFEGDIGHQFEWQERGEHEARMRLVREAEEWERRARRSKA